MTDVVDNAHSESNWLERYIAELGSDKLRKLNVGMSIGGTLIEGFEDFIAAKDANQFATSSFDDSLDYRQREFKHLLEQFKANNSRSAEALSSNYHAALRGIDQSRISAQEEIFNIIKEMRTTHARALTSAADREVYGNTVDLLLDSIMATEFRNIENVATEQKWGEEARMRQIEGLYSDAETQRLARVPRPMGPTDIPKTDQEPNPVFVAMRAGVEGLNAYTKHPIRPQERDTSNIPVNPPPNIPVNLPTTNEPTAPDYLIDPMGEEK